MSFPLKPEARAKEIVTLAMIGSMVSHSDLRLFTHALSDSFAGASGFSCMPIQTSTHFFRTL
jgi:hypothetical protein